MKHFICHQVKDTIMNNRWTCEKKSFGSNSATLIKLDSRWESHLQKKQLLRSRAAVSCLLLFSPFSPSSFPLLLPFPFPFYPFPDHLLLLFASSCPPLPPPKALTTALENFRRTPARIPYSRVRHRRSKALNALSIIPSRHQTQNPFRTNFVTLGFRKHFQPLRTLLQLL